MTDVSWDGAVNLHDLGGIPIATGVTASGRIFRSARPESMTDRGWSDARGAGVTTVVDLRNADERARHDTDPPLSGGALGGIRVVNTPIEDQDDPEFMRICGPWLDHPNYYPTALAMYPDKFAAAFRAIAVADGAVLVHCAGGRDRTGMIAAILLSLAGASPEAIGENYAAGFRGAHVLFLDKLDAYPHEGATADELEARVAARVPVLIDWIRAFDAPTYLTEAGLTRDELALVANRLLP
jgi:protein-tyrosine phosphatase